MLHMGNLAPFSQRSVFNLGDLSVRDKLIVMNSQEERSEQRNLVKGHDSNQVK